MSRSALSPVELGSCTAQCSVWPTTTRSAACAMWTWNLKRGGHATMSMTVSLQIYTFFCFSPGFSIFSHQTPRDLQYFQALETIQVSTKTHQWNLLKIKKDVLMLWKPRSVPKEILTFSYSVTTSISVLFQVNYQGVAKTLKISKVSLKMVNIFCKSKERH